MKSVATLPFPALATYEKAFLKQEQTLAPVWTFSWRSADAWQAPLAAVLFVVGYKLAKPANFKKMFNSGMAAFVPFVVTILAIVFIDLLKGLGIGLVVALIAGRVLPAKSEA